MGRIQDYGSFDGLGLAGLVAKGDVSAGELLDEAIAQVEDRNGDINAVVLKLYDRARAAIDAGLPEGPYRGVPFMLKDISTCFAGVATTNACELFRDFVPDHDSHLIARYKEAGLVICGKTATPEFGLTTSTESRMFGVTRNPWNLEYMAGGSSGGASALVSSGILPVADGSDGGGSIRIPASCCGLVGLKVSRGRIPVGPDAGERWNGMSTSGVLSRTVRDTAAMVDLSSGMVNGDPYTAPAKARPYLEETEVDPGRLRIAYHAQPYNGSDIHKDCVEAVNEAAKICADLGHEVEEKALTVDQDAMRRAARVIVSSSMRFVLTDRAEQLGRKVEPDDVEPITYALYETGARFSATDYMAAVRTIHDTGRVVAAFFEDYDVVLSPTMAAPPVKVEGVLRLDHPDTKEFNEALGRSTAFTQLFNAAGTPAISLPLHWNGSGLPIGLQFAARYGGEDTLIRLAAQLEKARPWRDKRPRN